MSRVILPPKLASEVKLYDQFDFTSKLQLGETIVDPPVFTAAVYSGTDPSPASIVVAGSAAVSGAVASVRIQAGVLGVIYELICTAVTSLGQTLILNGYLAIIPDLP